MFPFSPLPLLPQELILKQLDPVDIFFFSLISRKSHLLAKRVKVEARELNWDISGCGANFAKIVVKGDRDKLFFVSSRDESYFENMEVKTLDQVEAWIDGIQFRGKPILLEDSLFVLTENFETVEEAISRRLVDVLKVRKFTMCIYKLPLPSFIFDLTRTFGNVYASLINYCKPTSDVFTILNDISVDTFTMNCSVLDVSNRQPALKHKNMTLYDAKWLTKQHLMRMECEELDIIQTSLTSEDVQEFLEKWKEGVYPKLRHLSIYEKDGLPWDLNLAPFDEDGCQYIRDVGGNVGRLSFNCVTLQFLV